MERRAFRAGKRVSAADAGHHFWIGVSALADDFTISPQFQRYVSGSFCFSAVRDAGFNALVGLQTLVNDTNFSQFVQLFT